MAKNYATLYDTANASIALEQRYYIKEETTRGVFAIPTGADFLYSLSGGTLNHQKPVESSPHRSGRHHVSIIRQKTTTEWTLPLFFNIDTTLGAASVNEIDPALRVLFKSQCGKEDVTGGSPVYTTGSDPNTTFTLLEVGDQWSMQAPGAFVEANNMQFPGDGQAQNEFSGAAKIAYLVGIGKSTVSNNGGNTVTVQAGEGKRFPVGGIVMIVENDGTTRSADTATGTARTITSVTGDVVTLDGAALADADGSVNPVYLCYYEPESPVGINNPITGLTGSVSIVGLTGPTNCVRSATFNFTNNHELTDYCYGEEGLGGNLFTPGGRATVEVTLEMNLDHDLVEFMNKLTDFTGENITLILGDPAGRHLKVETPKVIFSIPEISVPDEGTIPISFTGNAYASNVDAADEITISFL